MARPGTEEGQGGTRPPQVGGLPAGPEWRQCSGYGRARNGVKLATQGLDTPTRSLPLAIEPRPVTIFVAEDNPVLLQGLDRALSANGYSVETAEDGPSILRRLSDAASPPDLLLLDVMMPGMSGLEVVEAVQRDPRLADLPVMLITASTGEAIPHLAARGGAVELLVKPFRLHDLLTRIEVYVQRRRTSADFCADAPPVPGTMA
jgi:CheY-like chemotaxis protein